MGYVFIAGRTLEQGRQEILGKHSDAYASVVGTLHMNADDLAELGLVEGGRVRVRTDWGENTFVCAVGDLPPGIVFAPYGPPTTKMMGGETHGTGMPDSKQWHVELEPVPDQSYSSDSADRGEQD